MTYYPVALLIMSLGWAIFSRKHFFLSCLLCYIRIMTCTWIFLLFSWKWIYVEQWIWFCLNLLHKILSVGNSSKKCSAILHEIDNNISSSIWLWPTYFLHYQEAAFPLPNNLVYYTHVHRSINLWQAYTLKNCQIPLVSMEQLQMLFKHAKNKISCLCQGTLIPVSVVF